MKNLYVRRYGTALAFRVGKVGGAFCPRESDFHERPASLWWRIGPAYTSGYGWHIRFFERPDDYRIFSERQGIVRVRKVGPLTIKRLTP